MSNTQCCTRNHSIMSSPHQCLFLCRKGNWIVIFELFLTFNFRCFCHFIYFESKFVGWDKWNFDTRVALGAVGLWRNFSRSSKWWFFGAVSFIYVEPSWDWSFGHSRGLICNVCFICSLKKFLVSSLCFDMLLDPHSRKVIFFQNFYKVFVVCTTLSSSPRTSFLGGCP